MKQVIAKDFTITIDRKEGHVLFEAPFSNGTAVEFKFTPEQAKKLGIGLYGAGCDAAGDTSITDAIRDQLNVGSA